MEREVCPLCLLYVSQWQIAGGKTLVVKEQIYHKSCLLAYFTRTGEDYIPQKAP